jgi:hypothetical protein
MSYEYQQTHDATTCKVCHNVLDAAMSEKEGEAPKKGDFSVCAYCATIGRWTEDGQIKPMSKGALEVMEEHDPAKYKSLQSVALMIKKIINDKS